MYGKTAMKIGAGLSAVAIMTAGIAPMAFATDPPTGKITINAHADQVDDVAYKVVQIFNAQVTETDDPTYKAVAKDLKWASANVKTKVLAAIDDFNTYKSGDTIPDGKQVGDKKDDSIDTSTFTEQDAADYIMAKMQTTTNPLDSNSFGMVLAKQLASLSGNDVKALPESTATTVNEGYVFVFTDSSTTSNKFGTGTAPVFAVVNDSTENPTGTVVNEKTNLPTVDKGVKEGTGAGAYEKAADVAIGERHSYLLTGTLPTSLASYDSYEYKFVDSMENMEIYTGGGTDQTGWDKGDVTVRYGESFDEGTAITAYNAQYDEASGSLTITIPDLKAIDGITADSNIYVGYQAELTEDANIGAAGNENSVHIEYSNNPYDASGKGKTNDATTKVYTYEVDVIKVDRDNTSTVIPGVQFSTNNTVYVLPEMSAAVSEGYEEATTFTEGTTYYEVGPAAGDYVEADPQPTADNFTAGVYYTHRAASPAAPIAGHYIVCAPDAAGAMTTVETDSEGKIYIEGLDDGTFELQETVVPDEYVKAGKKFTITITSAISRNAGGVLEYGSDAGTTFAVSIASENGNTTTDKRCEMVSTSAANGQALARIMNVLKENDLPRTGMEGIAPFIIAGIVLIGAGVVIGVRRVRSDD